MKYAYVYPKDTMKHILEEMFGNPVHIDSTVPVSYYFAENMWRCCGKFYPIREPFNRGYFANYNWDRQWFRIVEI